MTIRDKAVYEFEGFQLEPTERRLLGGGKSIPLTPKVFDTLLLLVQRAGQVVDKDEILKTVWPRGFVDESNLTKHIWLIRRALGESEHTRTFIETVPKLGYRFVAPVTLRQQDPTQHVAVAPDTPRIETPAAPPDAARPAATSAPRFSRRVITICLVTGILALAAAWYLWPVRTIRGSRVHRTVALVGFQNLSRNPKDAWIAPALTEMLSAELNVAPDLQVVPDEMVRSASAQLSPPVASGYSLNTLQHLARQLDSDYIVTGSYLVGGSTVDSPVRVEFSVQDAHSGSLLVSQTLQTGAAELMSLASRAGATLRSKLSRGSSDPRMLGQLEHAQPPTVEVARRVGFALEALQHDDAARARDELLEAIAEAPGYPLAYAHLAQAWTALGYREKALAAAEQAALHATQLPVEQRLQADATVAITRADWIGATTILQSLVKLKPQNPEYRLQYIDAQIQAGQAARAQVTLHDLRRLPEAMNDPRVELAAAHIAQALDDPRGTADHATLALRQAREHESPGLIAEAQLQLAHARERLGDLSGARASLAASASGYRSIRNPRGEALVHVALADLTWAEHHAQAAREEYQQAMALYQSIGDQAGMAAVYRDMCDMLWNAGDRDGAQTAAQEALQKARDIGDLHLQSWTLRALATIASDEAASDQVVTDYREVLTLTEKSGDRGGHVWSLAALADIQRLRGSLQEAYATCTQAKTEAAQLTDPQFAIYSEFTCALVDIDRGEAQGARNALNRVMEKATATKYPVYADNARMSLAQLDMDERQWAAARDKLHGAIRGFEADEVETGEADALAMLALCEQALGDRAAGEQAAARARKLREGITSRQEVYAVDIALAQFQANRAKQLPDKLMSLANDAEQRHFIAWALEARLAAWELLIAEGGAQSAAVLRNQLVSQAQRSGYGRVLKKLRMEVQSGS